MPFSVVASILAHQGGTVFLLATAFIIHYVSFLKWTVFKLERPNRPFWNSSWQMLQLDIICGTLGGPKQPKSPQPQPLQRRDTEFLLKWTVFKLERPNLPFWKALCKCYNVKFSFVLFYSCVLIFFSF